MVDGISLLNLAPGEDGEDMVIGEGEAGVLVAAVHHHCGRRENTLKLKLKPCSSNLESRNYL